MCILCVLQRASRRARNMLPWLVLALVGLWGLSQLLLPPPFRLEMTASRLACVLFLVGYFSWYEFLFPQLSLWRARRSARLRERRWSQAVELQKLRKAATRRCRNCLNAYKEQNPGGGRFMCSYCGHVSKRPVLDIPGPPGSVGIIGDILGRICSQDWQLEGNGGSRYGITGGEESCPMERSYSSSAFQLLSSLFLGVRRRVFRLGSSRGDGSSDVGDGQRSSSGKGENGVGSCRESRGEKARRRAEEKRRARLEKELSEEEERKQREEVARLMEEQRKFRDEKLETIKEQQFGGSCSERMRCTRKEGFSTKRQERSKDREMGSCKSSSDGEEEMEKKSVLEIDGKCDSNNRGDFESRNFRKVGTESNRTQTSEPSTLGTKGVVSSSRYLDRVRGSLWSTSTGFRGANFSGKDSPNIPVCAPKPTKPLTGSVEQQSNNLIRKEVPSTSSGRQTANGGSSTSLATHCPTEFATPPQCNVWKKSWHQLFTCSSNTDASSGKSSANDVNSETMPPNAWQSSADHTPGSQMPLSRPASLNSYREMTDSAGKTSEFSTVAEVSHTFVGVSSSNGHLEENGLSKDPSYVPDTISFTEPVSATHTLDKYPIIIGTEFTDGTRCGMFTKSSTTTSKPSPIESPLSRSCLSERQDSCSTGALQEPGVWKMWDTPLCRESLSMISASSSANRVSAVGGGIKPQQVDVMPSLGPGQMESIPEVDLAYFGILRSPSKLVESSQKGISHTPLEHTSTEADLWLENLVLRPLFNDAESQFRSRKPEETIGLPIS